MPNNEMNIKTIQFKRGLKAILEAKLTVDNLGVPLNGEPIYETDTKKLKIGDGKTAYVDLPYIQGSAEVGNLPNFIIQDPLSNQVLLYDADLQAWVNKDLADNESIIYLTERGLTIKGYDKAQHGYMLVKDDTDGLTWVQPLDSSRLNEALATAESSMNQAGNYAVQAGNFANAADTSAKEASAINQTTMTWVNKKFWWGTLEEYNVEIAENGLNPEAFYFIKP